MLNHCHVSPLSTTDWNKVRQNKILLAAVRAICVAVLTWGCVDTFVTSVTVSGVWTWTSLTSQPTVLSWHTLWHPVRQHRQILLQCYGTLRLKIDPILFAAKALGTLVAVPYYENLVCTVESVCFSKEYRIRYPLISRLQGLILSYLLAFGFIRMLTIMGIYVGTFLGFGKQWSLATLFEIKKQMKRFRLF